MLNPFIVDHNASVDPGFYYFRLKEVSTGAFYNVFHELGTSVIYIYTGKNEDNLKERIVADSSKSPQLKAIGLIRDKYTEGSRVLLPVRFTKNDYFKYVTSLEDVKEVEPIFIGEKLLFSLLSVHPVLNAILRRLMAVVGQADSIGDELLFRAVEYHFGNGVLEDVFAYRMTHEEQRAGKILSVLEDKLVYFAEDIVGIEQSVVHKGSFLLTRKPALSGCGDVDQEEGESDRETSAEVKAFVCSSGLFFSDGRSFLACVGDPETNTPETMASERCVVTRVTLAEWKAKLKGAVYILREIGFHLPEAKDKSAIVNQDDSSTAQ